MANEIRFENNQILFDSGAIAMHADCCCCEYENHCTACFDANKTPKYVYVTFSDVDDCGNGHCDWLLMDTEYILEQKGATPCLYNWTDGTYEIIMGSNATNTYIQARGLAFPYNPLCFSTGNSGVGCTYDDTDVPNVYGCGIYAENGTVSWTIKGC